MRLLLHEKRIDFNEKIILSGEIKTITANSIERLPILYDDNFFISNSSSVCEYIEEKFKDSNFTGVSLKVRSQVRKISFWLDDIVYTNSVFPIINEKILKLTQEHIAPDSRNIRAAKEHMLTYLEYIEDMIIRNTRLACEDFTIADMTLASHISSLDYTNDFPWEKTPIVKQWYAIVKSRPAFQKLLSDRIPYVQPPAHYANLDF